MNKMPEKAKDKLEHWLTNNLMMTNKSHVERIVDHVERYFYHSDAHSTSGLKWVKASEIEIYKHLGSLPYAGGYPDDWRETLAIHLKNWLESPLPSSKGEDEQNILWDKIAASFTHVDLTKYGKIINKLKQEIKLIAL